MSAVSLDALSMTTTNASPDCWRIHLRMSRPITYGSLQSSKTKQGSGNFCRSTNFPTVNPLQPLNRGVADAFVAVLDPTGGTLLYATYLGGTDLDYGTGIGVDGAGRILRAGAARH